MEDHYITCLSIYPIYLSIHLSIYLSNHLLINLYIHSSPILSITISIVILSSSTSAFSSHFLIVLSILLYPSPSITLTFSPFLCLSVYLSISISINYSLFLSLFMPLCMPVTQTISPSISLSPSLYPSPLSHFQQTYLSHRWGLWVYTPA